MHDENLIRSLTVFAGLVVACVLTAPAYAQSEADCAARADRASRDAVGVGGGAVRGGLGGAAFGAIVGGGKGARRGAALGAVVGGAAGAHNKDEAYKRAYDDCMRSRR